MLQAAPIYNTCSTIADQLAAAVKAAYPTLEVEVTNHTAAGPLVVQGRHPKSIDHWTPLASVGLRPRSTASIEVNIGIDEDPARPTAQVRGNLKTPPDATAAGTMLTQYIAMRTTERDQALSRAKLKRRAETKANALNAQLALIQTLPNEDNLTPPHLEVRGYRTNRWENIAEYDLDVEAVVMDLRYFVVTPEVAAQFLELWKPIAKLIEEQPPLKPRPSGSPAGILLN